MRRYALLFLAALAAAGAWAIVGRSARAVAPESAPAAAPPVTMTLGVYADSVIAMPASVPSGSIVELTVTNNSERPVRLKLAGYEDRVDTGALPPDESRRITFLADRPGERFPWTVDDQPRGRLDVTGSHLVEGHR